MPRIVATGTVLPEHVLTQHEVSRFAHDIYGEAFPDIDRLIGIFDTTEIEQRHFCVPLDWFGDASSFREKNDLYIDNAVRLSTQAAERCLEKAGMDYKDIDYLIYASTTGLSTPSIDARLIQQLPFRRNIRRLPIWGLGCAGGASSLARATDIARADRSARILIIVTELCGLTFMRNDLTKPALVASSLFADGSAAVLVAGSEVPVAPSHPLPRLLASQTTTLDNSLDVMGWDIGDEGFRVKISRDIPTIVRTFMRESIEMFLASEGLDLERIEHFIAHPGGAKILQAYADSLGLPPEKLDHTREVLRTCGNMSACSVLFVLERFMEQMSRPAAPDSAYGLLGALGPGFSAELVLLRWEGPAGS